MNKECYTEEYYFWIITTILPILFMISIVYSLYTYYILNKKKQQIYNHDFYKINLRFGYLF